ncbi:hypothetical protein V8F06_011734 [Rhypophila decipiens]
MIGNKHPVHEILSPAEITSAEMQFSRTGKLPSWPFVQLAWPTLTFVLNAQFRATAQAITTVDCTIHRVTRYEVSGHHGRAPVSFSASSIDDFELPMIEPMNGTAGEQWEFDGISSDGLRAFIFGFYRDPNYDILGTGNLRMYFEYAFANGSRYAIVDYAEESVITSCPDDIGRRTKGIWRSAEFEYTFDISGDMSEAILTWENPESSGRVAMHSVAPPKYADNTIWPAAGQAATVPHFYWVEPIPVAELTLDAVIYGEEISWISGMGGHERLWGAFNWYTCLKSMTAVRFRAGPYALAYVEFGSGRDWNMVVSSMLLAQDGVEIFGSRNKAESIVDSGEDVFTLQKMHSGEKGGVTAPNMADNATGVILDLYSPIRDSRWQFAVTHKNVGFQYVLGERLGGTAYSGIVEGGEVSVGTDDASKEDLKVWTGPAFTEIMRFPDHSWLLRSNYRA